MGKIVDTNGAYLGERLSSIGFDVALRVSIGDHRGEIRRWIRILQAEVDLIVSTGGLGPTQDDLTRQEAADAFGVPLVFQESLMREIEAIFAARGFRMTENNRRQAYLPEGATIISNPVGTAPAFALHTEDGKMMVCLPGVPKELKYLMEHAVAPLLREKFNLQGRVKRTRILKICGLGESGVDQQIGDLMKTEGNPFVGVLASPGMIRILITGEGEDEAQVSELIGPVEDKIRRRLGTLIFGADDETLEEVTLSSLAASGKGLSVDDTATGGEVARRLLKPYEGVYYSRALLGVDAPMPGQGETGVVSLGIHPVPEERDDTLRAFSITIRDGGKTKETVVRLGGPKKEVEARLSIIAVDRLRKWLTGL